MRAMGRFIAGRALRRVAETGVDAHAVGALRGICALLAVVNRSLDNVPSYEVRVVPAGDDAVTAVRATLAGSAEPGASNLTIAIGEPLDGAAQMTALRDVVGFMGIAWLPTDEPDDEPPDRDVRIGLNGTVIQQAAALLERSLGAAVGGRPTVRPVRITGAFPGRRLILADALLAEGPRGRILLLVGWSD